MLTADYFLSFSHVNFFKPVSDSKRSKRHLGHKPFYLVKGRNLFSLPFVLISSKVWLVNSN